jgi:hypothetical protein
VIYGGTDPQPAAFGRVHQRDGRSGSVVVLAAERILQRSGHPGIRACRRELLVREQFGLHGDPRLAVQRLHLVADRRDRPLGR